MFDFIKFFTPSYLFDLRPYIYPQTAIYLAAFFATLIVIALAIKIILAKNQEKFMAKLGNKYFFLLLTMGALGLALVWLRYEYVQILAARFWLVIWLIAFIWWLAAILKYQVKTWPKARQQSETRKLSQKYSK